MTSAPVQTVLDRLEGAKPAGRDKWAAKCPAHEDAHASLSIGTGDDGRALVHCHAGCDSNAVLKAIGLKPGDLFAHTPSGNGHRHEAKPPLGQPVATYDYVDAQGVLRFQVCRFEPKDFRQRQPDGNGGWTWKLDGVPRVLYRLPELLVIDSDVWVFVTEGEKDADNLAALGLVATCNSGGAGKWCKLSDDTALHGRRVAIIADKDKPGQAHAQDVAARLHGKAAEVKIIALPDGDVDGKLIKDASDWIQWLDCRTNEELAAALVEMAEAAPVWTPTASTVTAGQAAGDDIRTQLLEIWQTPKLDTTERHRAIADAVVQDLHKRGRFYFDQVRRDFAGVLYFDSHRKVLLPIRSDAFQAWLGDRLRMNRAERVFAFVQSACETEGLSERATAIEPATFWASRPGAFYLSNGPGAMVRVSAGSVELVDNGSDGVLFPYGATLPPWKLTAPVNPFGTCAAFHNLATAAPHGRDLFTLWACSLPSDQRTKPPLVVSGPIGGGKTRAVRAIFELYGLPPRIAALSKNGEGAFWVAADAGGLACFDNADTRIDWLPDALAAAATAGTLEKRRLYTDADSVSLKSRAWVAVTSASPSFAADAGLADRLLVVRLNRREGETADTALSDEIAANRDAGLSWIAHTLSRALADQGDVPAGLNARHPDFASLAVKIGRAMGRETQAIAALQAAERDKGLFNVENDTVGAALLDLLQAGSFSGTAAELLAALVKIEPSFDGTMSAKRLAKRIAKLWPHLENVFGASQDRDEHAKQLRYILRTPAAVAGYAGIQTAFS